MREWLPIKSAPRGSYKTEWYPNSDGSKQGRNIFIPEKILILTKDKEMYVAHWDSDRDPKDVWMVARGAEGWQNWEFYFEEKEVEGWMHLPKLPEEKESEI